jgi:hypothetical protein
MSFEPFDSAGFVLRLQSAGEIVRLEWIFENHSDAQKLVTLLQEGIKNGRIELSMLAEHVEHFSKGKLN